MTPSKETLAYPEQAPDMSKSYSYCKLLCLRSTWLAFLWLAALASDDVTLDPKNDSRQSIVDGILPLKQVSCSIFCPLPHSVLSKVLMVRSRPCSPRETLRVGNQSPIYITFSQK